MERSASLLLLAPACLDGSFPGPEGLFDFTNVDSFQAVHVRAEDSAQYSVDVSQLLHDGPSTRVCKGTLSVDGQRCSEVVCKLAHGSQQIARLRTEADLYRTKLAPLQGRYVPTFFGLFEGEAQEGETACLVLSYEGEQMQQSLYIASIDFR